MNQANPDPQAPAVPTDDSESATRPMRPFFVVWIGQAVSLLGTQSVQFALIWWLTIRTGSAAVLAGATLVALLPPALLGPLIGALVDRLNRKRIMLAADTIAAVFAAILAALFLTGRAGVPHVLALLFVRALAGAFHGPAMIASTSLMVPEKHLTRIQGLNQALQGGSLIVAAPLGAILVGMMPMAGVMLVDVATAAVAVLTLAPIHVPQPSATHPPPAGGSVWWADTVAGFTYLWRRPGHMGLLAMASVINLCMIPAFSLLPLFVTEQLRGSALQLGTLHSSFGLGMIGGGILLGVWGGFRRRIVTALVGLMAMGTAICGLGLVPPERFSLALVAMALIGITSTLTNGPIHAILQATVAPEYQGRVFTIYGSLSTLAAPIGLLFAAPIAEWLGVRQWFVAGGLICVVMGFVAISVPSIQRIEPSEADADPRPDPTCPVQAET